MTRRTRLRRSVRRAAAAEPLEPRRLISATMLKDVNATPVGSTPFGFTEYNGALYFSAVDDSGVELYRSDGTPGSAAVVKPGVGGRNLTAAGDGLYFIGASDAALWKTDGTATGTAVVSSLPGPVPEDNSEQMVPFKGTLYFTAEDGTGGEALWKVGAAGNPPTLVADPQPGFDSREPLISEVLVMGDTMYFVTNGPGIQSEIWKSNGTPAGTSVVHELPAVANLARLDAIRFTFTVGGVELKVSDGTAAGLRELRVFYPYNLAQGQPADFVNVNGRTYFKAEDDRNAGALVAGVEPWVTDGTPEGTHILKDVRPGQETSSPDLLGALGDKLMFTAWDGGTQGGLWASDGTPQGTQFLSVGIAWPAFSGGTMYFSGGKALWKTDGTVAGTTPVRSFSGTVSKLAPFRGGVAFEADDGAGGEPWFSDGTPGGTVPLGDLNTQTPNSQPFAGAPIVSAGDKVVFPAIDGTTGGPQTGLWASDGTPAGTRRITTFPLISATPSSFTIQPGGRYAYVFAATGLPTRQMWRTDGTDAGTVRVKNVEYYNDTSGTPPGRSTVLPNGSFVFAGKDNQGFGWEPWASDGTAAGTFMLRDIAGGGAFSYPGDFTAVGNVAYFTTGGTGNSQSPATALWRTDGTASGTVLVRNFRTAEGSRGLGTLVNVNGTLYFRATDANNRVQLWKTNGTTEGTVMVKQFGNTGVGPPWVNMVAFNGDVYFSAAPVESPGDTELWKSDGTEAGTQLVKDVRPGAETSGPTYLRVVNGRLAFTADDGETGRELWLSDGTQDGTARLDVNPGPDGSTNRLWDVLNGRLYFDAFDGVHGGEPWSTDGTPEGTAMVQDVRPGAAGSALSFPAAAGDHVVFWGNDGSHGVEPWVVTDPQPPATFVTAGVFYNNSAFDGGDGRADARDDAAIATDKQPLLPGQSGSFANVTSYSKGINGVMIDVAGLPPLATLTPGDFAVRARYGDRDWQDGPPPLAVSVRRGAGRDGTDRVTLIWKDYNPRDLSPLPQAVANGWLEVTLKATARTRLAAAGAFAFGNLVGDTGASPLTVDARDLAQVRAHQRATADVTSPYDINRDGRINAVDLAIVRSNQSHRLTPPPAPPITPSASATPPRRRPATRELLAPPS